MAQYVFNPSDFVAPSAKPMPVFLVLDNSGSMRGDKIDSLNLAVRDMLEEFKKAGCSAVAFQIAIVTFGTGIHLLQDMTDSVAIQWKDIPISDTDSCRGWKGKWDYASARGTPLGQTLKIVKAMIEDRLVVPSRSYRPAIILVSDGHPTDSWNDALNAFTQESRSSKCDRWAMAIGRDADPNVLKKFIAGIKNDDGTPRQLLYAGNAKSLLDNFKYITMSVTNSVAIASKSKVLTVKPISVKATELSDGDKIAGYKHKPEVSKDQGEDGGFFW